MNLALITAEGEYENLNKIALDNPSLFSDELFVNAKSSDLSTSSMWCVTFAKYFRRMFEYKPLYSLNQQGKFLCESVEISDTFEPKKSREIVNVKSSFYNALSNDNNDVNYKKYYLSRVALTPPAASIACKSFGMNLASPQNQEEYNKVQTLLTNLPELTSAAIAVIRSATDKKVWLDGDGNKKNYEINWYDDDSWKAETNENCAVFVPLTDSPMTDVTCTSSYPFICEDNTYSDHASDIINNREETEKFIEKFRSVTIDTTRFDFGFSKPSIQLSFFEAKLMCQSLGMELFTPDPMLDDFAMKESLAGIEASSFITGLTSMGTPDSWYSVKDGQVLNDITVVTDDEEINECSALVKDSEGELYFKDVSCTEINNFICQKISTVESFEYKIENDYE